MVLRIQRLSAHVANQIAAGEVIERPASVVKELLENALDAGANIIHIEIGFGGLNHIKVSDNGAGILADDLPLAIAAHATSKISVLNDLYEITSMGFRGEALASIASVSRLSLSSRPAGQAHAMMLRTNNDTFHLEPCARSQGTTIDVHDLFFNAPVRKKFLKTEAREYQAIESVVKRFALSAPAVALTLKHNDKITLALPAAVCEKTMLLRIKKLFGRTFIEHATYLDAQYDGMRLHGWVSGTAYQRSQNDRQWIYINQRMVKDKLLSHALKRAYDGCLHPGRHPVCLLYLTLPASDVDVNVHPTKYEVRFQQPRVVHDLISLQVIKALSIEQQPLTANFQSRIMPAIELSEPQAIYSRPPVKKPAAYHWLTLNNAYAVVILQGESFLLDVEQLLQSRLSAQLSEQVYPLASRTLLLPVRYAVDKINYLLIERVLPMFTQLGIQADFASESMLVLRSIPQLLPGLNIQQFLSRLDHTCVTLPFLQNALVKSHIVDAYQLSVDEQMDLITYVQDEPNLLSQFARRLDNKGCRGMFHV